MSQTNLFRVVIVAEPMPDHPKFWDIQFGHLFIYLFATSLEEARGDALSLARILRYKVKEEREVEVKLIVGEDGSGNIQSDHASTLRKECIASAREEGVAWLYVARPTGTDERELD